MKIPGREDLMTGILSAVDDECLEHVLALDLGMVGGGGVSYVFKKTKGKSGLVRGSMPLDDD